ncbi:MAG TPA: hypothetical protein VHA37_06675 [Candidatus Saccharimonadales bacterium]|nr:hypothetical protein [Candidatus Saccharimonadales bacterium]
MSSHLTIDATKLAKSNDYRATVLGTRVKHVTDSGTEIIGTITERPRCGSNAPAGGLELAITADNGQWAGIYAGQTFELVDNG